MCTPQEKKKFKQKISENFLTEFSTCLKDSICHLSPISRTKLGFSGKYRNSSIDEIVGFQQNSVDMKISIKK